MVSFVVQVNGAERVVSPQEVGAHIILELKKAAESNLSALVTKTVMSVPAEFDEVQRNFSMKAGSLAGEKMFCLSL